MHGQPQGGFWTVFDPSRRDKKSLFAARVTMQLLIDTECGILYISHHNPGDKDTCNKEEVITYIHVCISPSSKTYS